MMNTLGKICTGLTIVFAVSLVLLVAEIIYVIWRGRRLRRPSRSIASGEVEFASDGSLYATPSKELLYFFCWKSQTTRIEPDAETSGAVASAASSPVPPPSVESELDELMKQHSLYGPSRVLFTIKEEEREDMETDLSSAEREDTTKKKNKKTRGISLEEDEVAAVVIEMDESTPFSTPCPSPLYYTPSPSPRGGISPQSSISDDAVVLHDVAMETTNGCDTMSLNGIEVDGS